MIVRYSRGMGVITDVKAVQTLRYHPEWPLGDDISGLVAQADISVKGLVQESSKKRVRKLTAPPQV